MTKEEAFKWYESAIIDLKIPYVSGNDLRKKFEESWAKRNEPPSLQSQIDSLKQEVEKMKEDINYSCCIFCGGTGKRVVRVTAMGAAEIDCEICHGSGKLKRQS